MLPYLARDATPSVGQLGPLSSLNRKSISASGALIRVLVVQAAAAYTCGQSAKVDLPGLRATASSARSAVQCSSLNELDDLLPSNDNNMAEHEHCRRYYL